MDCSCPLPTALTTIVAEACGVNLSQIQKIAFQRAGDNFDSVGPPIDDILELASWQAKLIAVDDTKIVITPFIGADPIIEAGDAITTGGGDNSTLNGVEEIEGVNPASFSCTFKELPASTERALKELICEKSLVVYFFLQGGSIAAVEITVDQIYEGFPIQSVFVSDRNNAGFGTKDTVTLSFQLAAGYSDNLVKLKPNFNPLTDL